MSDIIHPQINISSVIEALAEEESALTSAFRFFNLSDYSKARFRSKKSTYQKVYDEFIYIGLLHDLDWDSKTDDDLHYIRLCLARAEKYRQINFNNGARYSGNISIENLPLGPLECITFKPESYLEHVLQKCSVPSTCSICCDVLTPTNTVLFPCSCFSAEVCSYCVSISIGSNFNTFHVNRSLMVSVPIVCPVCRKPQYYSVTNVEEAIKEEKRLISEANYRLNGDTSKRALTKETLNQIYKELNAEAQNNKWAPTPRTSGDVATILKDHDKFFPALRCDIARLQVQAS